MVSNGLLILTVVQLLYRDYLNSRLDHTDPNTSISNVQVAGIRPDPSSGLIPLSLQSETQTNLGPRHQWSYEQWVTQLQKEAEAVALAQPPRLSILAGDSLSLWFPPKLLPLDRTWLNQGISGETSTGLLKRLPLLDRTRPDMVFVMIGINDLLKGVNDETLLDNYRQIIRDLRWVHPNSKIVIQSILPHGGKNVTWEGRDRLLAIPNSRIRNLNKRLKEIINKEAGQPGNIPTLYLDLYPLFSDSNGDLLPDFTTDGLHLNDNGYLVWRSALQIFNQTN